MRYSNINTHTVKAPIMASILLGIIFFSFVLIAATGSYAHKEYVKGVVRRPGMFKIYAPSDVYVLKSVVKAGDHVNQGDQLFEVVTLNNIDPDTKIERDSRLKTASILNESTYALRERLAAYTKMHKEGLVSTNDLTEIKEKLNDSLVKVEDRLSDSRKGKDISIRAPVTGVIDGLFVEIGDYLSPRDLICVIRNEEISTKQTPTLMLYASSMQVGSFDIDNNVAVMVDTFPYEKYGVLMARVNNISSSPMEPANPSERAIGNNARDSDGIGRLLFPVSLDIVDSSNRIPISALSDGMTVKAILSQPKLSLFDWLIMPVKKAFIRNPKF